jgi:TetR/AcrR family transcriptional regulator, transcriptional repressor for nem operon
VEQTLINGPISLFVARNAEERRLGKDGTQTKRAIMDAAERLVFLQGFAATSVDEVIGSAGVTKGAFFHHFRTKSDLGHALVERFARRDRAHLERNIQRAERLAGDPLTQLLILVGLFEEDIESLGSEIPACLFACYIYEAQLFDERTLDIVADGLLAWRELLRPKFEEALRHCEPQRLASADELADLLLATIEGAMILGRSHRDPTLLPRQLRQYRNYLELLFARRMPAAAPGNLMAVPTAV